MALPPTLAAPLAALPASRVLPSGLHACPAFLVVSPSGTGRKALTEAQHGRIACFLPTSLPVPTYPLSRPRTCAAAPNASPPRHWPRQRQSQRQQEVPGPRGRRLLADGAAAADAPAAAALAVHGGPVEVLLGHHGERQVRQDLRGGLVHVLRALDELVPHLPHRPPRGHHPRHPGGGGGQRGAKRGARAKGRGQGPRPGLWLYGPAFYSSG